MRNYLFGLAVAVALAMAPHAGAAQDMKWKIGSPYGPNDSTTVWMQNVADEIRQQTGGKLDIEVVLLSALSFTPADALRILREGQLDGVLILPYALARDEPLLANLLPSHTVLTHEQNFDVADVQFAIARQTLAKWDAVLPIPQAPSSLPRDLILVSREPIHTIAELKGKKIRSAGQVEMRGMQALGIAAQNMAANEIYLSLKTGVIDGAVFVRSFAASQSLGEVACCYSVLSPFPAAQPIGIAFRKDAWEALSEDMRNTIEEGAEERYVGERAVWLTGAGDDAAAEKLKAAGMRELEPFSLEDRTMLRDAILAAWKESVDKLGEQAAQNYEMVSKALLGAQ